MEEWYKKSLEEFLAMCAENCPPNLTEEQLTKRTKMLTELFEELVVRVEDELEEGKQAMQYDYSVIRKRLNEPEPKTLWQKIKRLCRRLRDRVHNLRFPDPEEQDF